MKTKSIFIFSIVFLLGIIGYSLWYFTPHNILNDKITIKCNYMAYACGDCVAQYHVQNVLPSKKEYLFLLDKDINIDFTTKKMAREISLKTSDCIICYDFTFSGRLKWSKAFGYLFVVEKCEAHLRFKGCCDNQ